MGERVLHDIIPVITFAIALVLLVAIRSILLRVLCPAEKRDKNPIEAVLYRVFRFPSLLWCLAIAIHIAIGKVGLPEPMVSQVRLFISILVILSVCFAVANALEDVVKQGLGAIDSAMARSGLIRGLIRGAVFTIGFLVILAKMDVHIGPMLTALGVGGLAVGLALQNTLGNLFAGISMVLDRSYGVGDRIKLASGDAGEILDIGWRTTHLQLDSGDRLIVPNTKLSLEAVVLLKRGDVTLR